MKFIKKHKVGLIILAIVAAIIIGLVILIGKAVKNAESMLAELQNETAVVERRDLVTVVSTTGTVVSLESKSVTAEVSGVEIEQLLCAEGDIVNEGDLICVLSADDLNKQLADATASKENTAASSNLQINSANRQLNDTQTNNAITKERNDKKVADSKEDVKDYEALRDQSYDQYWAAMTEANEYQAKVEEASKKVTKLTNELAAQVAALVDEVAVVGRNHHQRELPDMVGETAVFLFIETERLLRIAFLNARNQFVFLVVMGIYAVYAEKILLVADVHLIRRTEKALAKRKIIDGIEDVGLPCPIQAHETIHIFG